MLHCKCNDNQTQWDNNSVLLSKHHVDKGYMHMHNFSEKEQQVMCNCIQKFHHLYSSVWYTQKLHTKVADKSFIVCIGLSKGLMRFYDQSTPLFTTCYWHQSLIKLPITCTLTITFSSSIFSHSARIDTIKTLLHVVFFFTNSFKPDQA